MDCKLADWRPAGFYLVGLINPHSYGSARLTPLTLRAAGPGATGEAERIAIKKSVAIDPSTPTFSCGGKLQALHRAPYIFLSGSLWLVFFLITFKAQS